MISPMQLLAIPSLLAASAYAQSLTSVLSGNTNLSSLAGLLRSNEQLTTLLGSATNVTLLAPSNDAIAVFLASNATVNDNSIVNALLQYHIVNGSYKSSDFTGNSTFLRTALTDSSYTKVTGGQRVEALISYGKVTLISGNLYNTTASTTDIKFDGGYVHIIDHVLVIPPKLASKPSLSNAGVTVSALYNLLSTTNLLDSVSDMSDVTIFAPSDKGLTNTASQLSALSGTDAENVAKYHVVQGSSGPYYTPRFNQAGNTTLTALSGGSLTITATKGANNMMVYYVNGARIVASNWLSSGGVLHVIDNVLSPSNSSTFLATPAISSSSSSGSGSSSGSSGSSGSGTTGNSTAGGAGAKSAAGRSAVVSVGSLVAVAAIALAL